MAIVLMDDCFLPTFNAVDGVDVGPGTPWTIRYTKAQFESMITRYIDDTASFRVGGPLSVSATWEYNGGAANSLPYFPGWDGKSWNWINTGGSIDSGGSSFDDYPGCPYIDGVAPPRESAVVNIFATVDYQLKINFRNARIEQSGWDTYTHIWLPFNLEQIAGSWDSSYQCDGGSGNTLGGGPIVSNLMGFDYTSGGSITGEDFKTAIGDGYMSAYFKDPGPTDKLTFSSLQTTN